MTDHVALEAEKISFGVNRGETPIYGHCPVSPIFRYE